MKFDATDRLQKINEAMVNLFEFGRGRGSRAAQREAQRTGRGEMTTGRDGNQYPLGADPTRAQPGSALANQPVPQSREDAFLAAQPRMKAPTPTPAARPAARPAAPVAPVAPAPRPASSLMAAGRSVAGSNLNPTTPTSPSLAAGRSVAGYNSGSAASTTPPSSPGLTDIYKMGSAAFGGEIKAPPSSNVATAPKAQGNIQLPAAAATALGQGDPAMKAYVGQLDRGDSWRGQTKKPEPTPAKSAAAPAPKATTPNFVEITPEEQSRVSGETAKAPASATTTQTSEKGSGSLEQDVGGMLRSVGLVPSAGGSPKAPKANTPAAYGSQDQRPENQRNYQSVYFGSQNQSTVSSPKASASAPTKSAAKNTEYPEYDPNKPSMTSRMKGNLYANEVRPGEQNTITRATAHGSKIFLPGMDQDTVNIRELRRNPSATNWSIPGNENPTADKNRESFRQIAQQKTEVPQYQSSTSSETAAPVKPTDKDSEVGFWARQLFRDNVRQF